MSDHADLPLVDSHVHMRGLGAIPCLHAIMRDCRMEAINVVSLAARDDDYLKTNVHQLLFKVRHPGRVYSFGGLRHSRSGDVADPLPYREQARRLMAMGCDGIKMIEGKPTVRKQLGEPLDGPDYAPFYDYLEEQGIPLLFHVADPETFWDPELAPAACRERGWFYGDGTFPSKQQLYAEAEGVLRKHPRLRVLFAHFYFLSADLDRLAGLLDRHPRVNVDITPGTEMYPNFSRQRDRARAFFIDYADRIFFGTDNSGSGADAARLQRLGGERMAGMRRFLETDDRFEWWDMRLHGLALPPRALESIYAGNFRRWAGRTLCPVDTAAAIAECERLMELAENSKRADLLPDLVDIRDGLQAAMD